MKKSIIIVGSAGFIDWHVIQLFVNNFSEYKIVNLGIETYVDETTCNKR